MRGSLRSFTLLALLGGCQCDAGAPPPSADVGRDVAPAGSSSEALPLAASAAGAPAASAGAATTEPRFVGASQILIAFKGAELADPKVTRSKADAKKRAEEVLAKLTQGTATFEELARAYSDDATKVVGGAVGNFERGAMPNAFSDAAFALSIGQTSGIVETARGFHLIRRTR